MSVVVVGLNHRTVPLDLFERMTVAESLLPKALADLTSREHITEAVVLSTCNRIEVYAFAEKFHGGYQDIREFFEDTSHVPPEEFSDHLTCLYDADAARHLFAVASGLDSAVIGEHEILGQVRSSWETGAAEGAVGPVLNPLFRHALEVGKRVRTETAISRNITSVSQAAVAMAKERLDGLEGRRVLVVGAGEMGEGLARALHGGGVSEILVANRTWDRAVDVAARLSGTAVRLDELPRHLAEVDVLLTSTGASSTCGRSPRSALPSAAGRSPPSRPSSLPSSTATSTSPPPARWRRSSLHFVPGATRCGPVSSTALSAASANSTIASARSSRPWPPASSASSSTSRPCGSRTPPAPPAGSASQRPCATSSTSRPRGPVAGGQGMRIRIATRGSPLARWQAERVADLLRTVDPDIDVEFVVVATTGDLDRTTPLEQLGGQGVFVKEVQAAVLDGRADVAVHSAKDLPALTPDGLILAAVPERGDPRDALVGCCFLDLPDGARVATGSIRRRAHLAYRRPDLHFEPLRGNIATRLAKAADFDAIVIAQAALDRLGLTPAVVDPLDPGLLLPPVAQGALAVACRSDDAATTNLLAGIEDPVARRAVDAERGFLAELGAGCDLPVAAHARALDGAVELTGALSSYDGGTLLLETRRGAAPGALGRSVARHLLGERGGATLLGRP